MWMRCLAILLLSSASMAAGRQARGMRGSLPTAQAPAPAAQAPAPAPDTPSMPTTTIETTIENLNYYDLTKEWKDPLGTKMKAMTESIRSATKGKVGGGPEADGPIDDSPAGPSSTKGSTGADPLGEMLGAVDDSPAGDSPDGDESAALVQVGEESRFVTVQAALKKSIETTIAAVLTVGPASYLPSPAPAPALAVVPEAPVPPQGLLPSAVSLLHAPPWGNGSPPVAQMSSQRPAAAFPHSLRASPGPAPAGAPGGAPAPGPAMDTTARPKVHVGFSPGKKIKKKHLINSPPTHAATKVKITLYERPGNGFNDMAGITEKLRVAVASGALEAQLSVAIHQVTGVKPKLSAIKVEVAMVKQWDIQKCGGHMSMLVKSFTIHYTKRQVPMALYNECTNFMTKMSFSHDYILDPRDAARCRKATKTFAQRWKLGDNKDPAAFEPMCQRFCEAKFGDDAPQCQLIAP